MCQKLKRNPQINVQRNTQADTIKRPVNRAIETKPHLVNIHLEELKALSGDGNTILDLVKIKLSGSPNIKKFIQEKSDIPTTKDDASQDNDYRSRSLPCEAYPWLLIQ